MIRVATHTRTTKAHDFIWPEPHMRLQPYSTEPTSLNRLLVSCQVSHSPHHMQWLPGSPLRLARPSTTPTALLSASTSCLHAHGSTQHEPKTCQETRCVPSCCLRMDQWQHVNSATFSTGHTRSTFLACFLAQMSLLDSKKHTLHAPHADKKGVSGR